MDYLDFIIKIDMEGNISSHFQNEKDGISKFQLSETDKNLIKQLSTPGEIITKEHVMDFGQKLKNALFNGEVEKQFAKAKLDAEKIGYGVRILLDVVPPFTDYPWEIMCDKKNPMATDIRTPIVRIFDGCNTPVNLQEKPPKFLFILSNVSGQMYVNTAKEMEVIEGKFSNQSTNIASWKKIDRATRDKIRNTMNQEIFNVIHFAGHGNFEDDTGYLALADENDNLDKINEVDLSALFKNSQSIGLIILNACETGKVSNPKKEDMISSNFSGLVPRLLQTVPAVIAMRQPISKTAAKSFIDGLYSNNITSESIEEILQKTRNNMFTDTQCNGNDFSIPALYMGWRKLPTATTETTARRILAKSYVEFDALTTPRSSQMTLTDIMQSITNMKSNYMNFKNNITSIMFTIRKPSEFSNYCNQDFLWKHWFEEITKICDINSKNICQIRPTQTGIVSEKQNSLSKKLNDLYGSFKKGIKKEIDKSLEECDTEFELFQNFCIKVTTVGLEVH